MAVALATARKYNQLRRAASRSLACSRVGGVGGGGGSGGGGGGERLHNRRFEARALIRFDFADRDSPFSALALTLDA